MKVSDNISDSKHTNFFKKHTRILFLLNFGFYNYINTY